jgi:hypothetical protein
MQSFSALCRRKIAFIIFRILFYVQNGPSGPFLVCSPIKSDKAWIRPDKYGVRSVPNPARFILVWMYTSAMEIDFDTCYEAVKNRNTDYDGVFYTGVSSTGIFCRPVCPAVTPKPENCDFYPSAAAALQAGYRTG